MKYRSVCLSWIIAAFLHFLSQHIFDFFLQLVHYTYFYNIWKSFFVFILKGQACKLYKGEMASM